MFVGVLVGVAVGVCVGVFVGVSVGVRVGVMVGVSVGVTVGVCVGVLVEVSIGIFVGVSVGVFVGFSRYANIPNLKVAYEPPWDRCVPNPSEARSRGGGSRPRRRKDIRIVFMDLRESSNERSETLTLWRRPVFSDFDGLRRTTREVKR